MQSLFERPARDQRYASGARNKPAILLAAMGLPILLLLSMLALTPLGHWQMDELLMMRSFRENGLPALLQRILTWSPRPFSESLLYAYSKLVHATGRQLTGTFLLALWGMLIAACLLPAALIRRDDDIGRRGAFVLALTVLALLISGHPVSEVFYWTQAAGAYIPTIAFIAAPLLCLVLAERRSLWLDATLAVCLSLAAMSSEVGAFFGIAWGAGAPLLLWLGRHRVGTHATIQRRDALFLAPLLSGLGVVYMLATARFGSEAEIFEPTVARHFGRAIWWTLTTFPADVLAIDLVTATDTGVLLGFVSKAALFALCLLFFARTAGRSSLDLRILIAAFGIAALASALFSLFAAYYQFGVNCCQRHQTIRSQLVVVAVVTLAFLAAQFPPMAYLRRRHAVWMATASLVAVASSAAYLPAAMDHDFARYRRILQARAANWNDGMSSNPTMTLRLSHRGEVVGGIYAPAGTFEDNESSPRPVVSMMHYFNKSKITAE